MRRTYKIHPGIGIARVGNSATDWFDGPETPDLKFVPAPSGNYRDTNGQIRRQATAFRIYEYTYDDIGRLSDVRQITDQMADIQWHVTLANLKSFTRNPMTGTVPFHNTPPTASLVGTDVKEVVGNVFGQAVSLGTARKTADGILRVLGGYGRSGSSTGIPGGGLYWQDWFDDVADGPVRATIRFHSTGEVPDVEPSWVVTGVPGFAHPIIGIVNMYDLAFDIAVTHFGLIPPREVSFSRDVFPLLQRVVLMQWVDPDARRGHGPSRGGNFLDPSAFVLLSNNDATVGSPARTAREDIFQRLKNPAGGGGDMPQLASLTVTPFQYQMMQRWSVGDFMADWSGLPSPPPPFSSLGPLEQTQSLDQTGLWTGVGGSFHPGIEVGERFGEASTFESPFRIRRSHPAGFLTQTLSVPWQVDFSACGRGWWPSGRPNSVTRTGSTFIDWARFPGATGMLDSWWKLGFLAESALPDGRQGFLETEWL